MTKMTSKGFSKKFIRRPWIKNVLLSENLENPVPKKVKARVTMLHRRKNMDGTRSGEITDYVHAINVVFSEEAAVECLEDEAHGYTFKSFREILGGAIVITDYKVVPCLENWEFVILINHFKVMPGFIGPLAYTEDIPNNLKMSYHLEVVMEKLRSLRTKQYDTGPCAATKAKDGVQPVANDQTTHESQSDLSETNSQDKSRYSLSQFVVVADEILNEKEERQNLIELYRNYEPLEDTSDLELPDVLDRIHIAHMKYGTFSPELQSFSEDPGQAIQMVNSDVGHGQTATNRCQRHEEVMAVETDPASPPQNISLNINFTNLNKADLIELCQSYYKPLKNTEELGMADVFKMLHQAHIKYAPVCYSD